VLCTLLFPKRKRYDLFLSEGAHFPPVAMQKLKLLEGHQRTAALMANETLYFLKSGYYSERTRRKLLWLLRSFDALICIGEMQFRLANEILKPFPVIPRIYEAYSAITDSRYAMLRSIIPDIAGNSILFIGTGPGGFRIWYKGLDLLMDAFERALRMRPGLRLEVVGQWEESAVRQLCQRRPAVAACTTFSGDLRDIGPSLRRASLYVHLGRGEAFGISALEAMTAGIPAIVSEWTGASEAVRRTGDEWVVPLDPEAAAEQIVRYFRMNPAERLRLSDLSREAAAHYREDRATTRFREVVLDIVSNSTSAKGKTQ
jgi:glycosyltransferase involved in cell wall biosynthesis